jgi:hypothetical protein
MRCSATRVLDEIRVAPNLLGEPPGSYLGPPTYIALHAVSPSRRASAARSRPPFGSNNTQPIYRTNQQTNDLISAIPVASRGCFIIRSTVRSRLRLLPHNNLSANQHCSLAVYRLDRVVEQRAFSCYISKGLAKDLGSNILAHLSSRTSHCLYSPGPPPFLSIV